ncbi:hypothetical protein A0U92_15060 [Acetobacter aceti]|uniref:Uncharacterized protein n=1 Tax=Acetobacter aceti TaxID=435 RepID=A0A1U9KJ77_ACEAC|nr:hypothetical protein A0U92_15060 [Acetobacter aceti]
MTEIGIGRATQHHPIGDKQPLPTDLTRLGPLHRAVGGGAFLLTGARQTDIVIATMTAAIPPDTAM